MGWWNVVLSHTSLLRGEGGRVKKFPDFFAIDALSIILLYLLNTCILALKGFPPVVVDNLQSESCIALSSQHHHNLEAYKSLRLFLLL